MLMLSSIFLLLSNAMNSQREASILYSRIAIFVLVYPMWFLYNQTIYLFLEPGIALFNGLFHVNLYTITFWYFLLIFFLVKVSSFLFIIFLLYENLESYFKFVTLKKTGKRELQKILQNFFSHILITILFILATYPIIGLFGIFYTQHGNMAFFLKPLDLIWKCICMHHILIAFSKQKNFTRIVIGYLVSMIFITVMILMNISVIDLFGLFYSYLPMVVSIIGNLLFEEIVALQSIILDSVLSFITTLQGFVKQVIIFTGLNFKGYRWVKTTRRMLPFTGYGFYGPSDDVPNNSSRRLRPPRSRPDQFNTQPPQGSQDPTPYQTSQNQFDTQSNQQYNFQVNPSQLDTRSRQHFSFQNNFSEFNAVPSMQSYQQTNPVSSEFNAVPSMQSYQQTNPVLSNIIPQLQPSPFVSHSPLQQEPVMQLHNPSYYQGLPSNLAYDSQNHSVTDPVNSFANGTGYQSHSVTDPVNSFANGTGYQSYVSEPFANNTYSSARPFQSNSLSLQSAPNAQFYYDPNIHVTGSPSASNSLGFEPFSLTQSSNIAGPDNPEKIPIIDSGPENTLADHTLGHELNSKLLQDGKFRIIGASEIRPYYNECFYYDRQYLDKNRYVVTKDGFIFSVVDKTVIVDEGLLRTNPSKNVSYILEEHLLTHTIRNNPTTLVSSLKFTEQSIKDLVHSTIQPYSQKRIFSKMSGNVVERLKITKGMILHLRKDIT